ncbi:T9SS type A sorting domain-containing protein [Changchengzhania lutea]|uniref:T9SS type A sorting domain-containing protein n=1 Tax=Changchengzhania lutea TaxID=2049305 RepID=UPI00115CA4B1|nr:T9SS type A sorting domain-containing protein [Changchengzhania lutea]
MKKYLLLSVLYFSCIFFGFPQIVNMGDLHINPLTVVYFGSDYTNNGVHNNEGDLYLNSHFINNGTTSSTSGTTFFKSAVNNTLTISGTTASIHFYNLEVNVTGINKKGVSVPDGFGLYVENSLILESGDLRLVGDAQLVQTHTGASANTAVLGTLLKDQQGVSTAYAYNYWASPVTNSGSFSMLGGLFDGTDANVNPFTPQQVSFNMGSPFNGTPSITDGGGTVTTPLEISTTWLYTYSRGSGSYADWIQIDENSTLAPGEGYTMKGTNTVDPLQNYVLKGTPNDGTYLLPISAGESSLIGNPYPSAIDSHKFINDNMALFNGTLYFWVDGSSMSHNLSDYLGGYATRNLTGGTPPSVASSQISGIGDAGSITPPTQYMSVGQGFFIDATATGNIVFDNSQRVFKTESSGDSKYYKSSANKKTAPDDSYVRIGYEDPEGFHRQLLLGFLPNSTADLNYNLGYDSEISDVREDELFYIIDDNLMKKHVIQGVGTFDELYEFPLGLIITEAGTHTIMLDAVENFSGPVYIKDHVSNTTQSLSASHFDLNLAPGDYLDRFSIVFKPQEVLNNDAFEPKNIRVNYDGMDNIKIINKKQIKLIDISVFNILGQKIIDMNPDVLTQKDMTIPLPYSDGLYLVRIESSQSKETYKILKH